MLNKKGERELCYLVKIDDVLPHLNADRLEIAKIGGWRCVVGKGEFKKGDIGVYFEVDSRLPACRPFCDMEFLASKNYKIKIQKIRGEYSQGFLTSLRVFEGTDYKKAVSDARLRDESRFLTKALNVTYNVEEDNSRKAEEGVKEKYTRMANRIMREKPKIARKKWFTALMGSPFGRKLLFMVFGKDEDMPRGFPKWIVKTDEERIENCAWMLENKEPFVKTEKIDGTSLTVFLDTTLKGADFGVCSRNMRQKDIRAKDYHSEDTGTNCYWEAAIKYNMQSVLERLSAEHDVKRVVLQGEVYGDKLQGNPYKLTERRFAAFNLIFDGRRLGSVEARDILLKYDIPLSRL